MSDAALALAPQDEIAPLGEDEKERPRLHRSADLLGRQNSACRKFLVKQIEAIVKGFEAQADRSDSLDKWWNIYNCILDQYQFYNGNAQVYVPIIHDAINARATRFANQLFPQSGRYVDTSTSDGSVPYELMALVNHYIRSAKFKTAVVKPLLRNGDIEGQYNLYVDWATVERQIVSRETHGPMIDGEEVPGGEEIEDIVEEDIVEGMPGFEVLHDADVLVLPQTANSIEEALALGGSVTIVRRWSREKLDRMIEDGEVRGDSVDRSDDAGMVDATMSGLNDQQKKLAAAVGVRAKGPHIVAFETWAMLPLSDGGSFADKGKNRLCRYWWGIDRQPLGLKRNPYWNDRCPLFSGPVEKVAGVFKGKSQVEALAPLQYEANDAANERADVDHYSAMPMVRRTPGQGNPPIVLNLGAILDAKPGDVEFMAFPDLSQRASARIMAATQVIFQSLGVNPAMLPQQSGRPGAKRSQAEVAMEQSVDLLTTAEAVSAVEEWVLTPTVAQIVDLDHQFRDRALSVREYGPMGMLATMIDVSPLVNRHGCFFSWCGAEQARLNAAMQQQGIAFLNIARGLRQELQQEGYQLRIGPLFERSATNIFGPITGSQTLVDMRRQLAVDTGLEVQLMLDGFETHPSPFDNDQEKIAEFQKALQVDLHGTIRMRLQEQIRQAQVKAQAMAMQRLVQAMQQGGGQPQPGGPRRAGTPPGASPAPPRQMKGVPGAIHPDQMPKAGVVPMPRRM